MTELLRLHVIPGGRADQPAEQPAKKEAPKAPAKETAKEPAIPEPLWREVLGDQLRELRRHHQESLAETAARAGISPQYLSELERGLKEPSSEMIAAVAGALGTTLGGLAESVADVLRMQREASAPGSRHELATRHDLAARRELVARRELAAQRDFAARLESAAQRESAMRRELAARPESAVRRELAARQDLAARRELAARRRASGPMLLALAA